MKAAVAVLPEVRPEARTRLADYLELTKPKVAVLVLFTVAVGGLLAAKGKPDPWLLLHALCGTALVASGASALNQLLERHSDALMRRTENRPLPSGRLQPLEVLLFGSVLGASGVLYLGALTCPLSALIAGFTFVSYVFLYTPLKRMTTLNTVVGAVPGALPPVIGWAAVRGTVDLEAVALFLILFLWQVPHFLAIAWIYREDYARAGLRMLPAVKEGVRITGRQMVTYCLALIPVSLLPVGIGAAGPLYTAGAILLGLGFLVCVLAFAGKNSGSRARRVLRASLVYLPVLLALLIVDGALR